MQLQNCFSLLWLYSLQCNIFHNCDFKFHRLNSQHNPAEPLNGHVERTWDERKNYFNAFAFAGETFAFLHKLFICLQKLWNIVIPPTSYYLHSQFCIHKSKVSHFPPHDYVLLEALFLILSFIQRLLLIFFYFEVKRRKRFVLLLNFDILNCGILDNSFSF